MGGGEYGDGGAVDGGRHACLICQVKTAACWLHLLNLTPLGCSGVPRLSNGCPGAYLALNATFPGLTVAAAAIGAKSAWFRWFFSKLALSQPLQVGMTYFQRNRSCGNRYT